MTTLRPEQVRALDYLRRKGTEASAAAVHSSTERAFRRIEGLLDEIPAETAPVRPPQGGWCVHEVVDHLVVSHRPALEQLRALLEVRPPGAAVPAGLVSDEPFAKGWEVLVGDLKQLHRDFGKTLAGTSDDVSTDGRADIVMVVKAAEPDGSVMVLEWVQGFDWKAFVTGLKVHTLEHVAQIERIRGQV